MNSTWKTKAFAPLSQDEYLALLDNENEFVLLQSDPNLKQGLTILGLFPSQSSTNPEEMNCAVQTQCLNVKLPFWMGYLSYEAKYHFILPQVFLLANQKEAYWIYQDETHIQNYESKRSQSLKNQSYHLMPFENQISYQDYEEKILAIQEHILSGDVYQVNFAHRFTAPFEGSVLKFYQELSENNPAPFMSLIKDQEAWIISNSPEEFIKVQNRQIRSRPIKGTRPRSSNPIEDAAFKEDLMSNPKDKAELLMITDLMRNDLGKICQAGTIRVEKIQSCESYSNVHHLVSEITGTLKEDISPLQALQESFPAGSISGAPKIKAMELIKKYEESQRGAYTGCIGYFNDESAHFNVAIRTAEIINNIMTLKSGGGIVADSEAKKEFQETLDKAKNFFKLSRGK